MGMQTSEILFVKEMFTLMVWWKTIIKQDYFRQVRYAVRQYTAKKEFPTADVGVYEENFGILDILVHMVSKWIAEMRSL